MGVSVPCASHASVKCTQPMVSRLCVYETQMLPSTRLYVTDG